MKKIAFILQKLTGGGAERTVANLSFALSEYYDVYLILFDGSQISYPYKGTVISLDAPSKPGMIDKCINVVKRTTRLSQIKKQYDFDVVISFMFGANFINVLSRKKEKIITSARNYMSAYGPSLSRQLQERFTGKKADKIIAISEMVRQDLIRNFRLPEKKIDTIYNPCDIHRIRSYASAQTDFVFEDDCFYFITAGRLVRQKGQWDLLKAFRMVSEEFPNARLLILGTGPLREDLEKLANTLQIGDKVAFLGFQDNPYAFMKRADAFVLTSLHEGLGNVVLEAMACDLPVISTDCYAGPREILAPDSDLFEKAKEVLHCKYGILVPQISNEPDFTTTVQDGHRILASAMAELMRSKELQDDYKSHNAERLLDFAPEKIAKCWIESLASMGSHRK